MQCFYELQPLIWKFLTLRFSHKNLSHSLLFLGRETQFEIALDFAKFVFCNSENKPCNTCQDCLKVNAKTHPDLFILESDNKTIKIEMIRDLIKKAHSTPVRAEYKIFIIKDAKDFNLESANAFLKTLEEPPLDCFFILITESKENLLPTIVSRCFRIYFPYPDKLQLIKFIIKNYNLSEEEAKVLAKKSGYSLNKLRELKDKNLITQKKDVLKRAFSHQYKEFADREKLKKDLDVLISFLRDLIFYKLDLKEEIFNIDLNEYLQKISFSFKIENILKILETFFKIKEAQNNINLRLASLLVNEVLRWQS